MWTSSQQSTPGSLAPGLKLGSASLTHLSPMACIINLRDKRFTQYHNILLMHHEYGYALATKDNSSLIV